MTSDIFHSGVPCPKGRDRSKLGERGLIGKVTIISSWSDEEVREEISSIFRTIFKLKENEPFLFQYLGLIPGTKKMDVINASRSFVWNGTEVLKIAGQGALYILASVPYPDEDSDDDSDCKIFQINYAHVGESSRRSVSTGNYQRQLPEKPPDTSFSMYQTFVNLTTSKEEVEQSKRESDTFYQNKDNDVSNAEVMDDVSSETVRDIVTLHKAMVHPAFEDEVGHMRLMVRRGMLLDDCFMKMSRAKADELKLPVQVSFVGEPAVDEGGPSREFFGLVFQELAQSSLLTGCSGNQCFSSYTPFLQKNHYKLAGQLVSLSFLNGGPGPHLFCVAIAERITYGKRISPLKVEDVPDRQLKEHLIKTSNMNNENEFLNYVERNLDRRHGIGYSKPLKLTDKKELVDTLISDSIGMNGAGVYQFIEGLETCNLLTVLRKHPKTFTPLFCKPANDLTAIEMLDLFLPVFSDVGSNRRRVEEEIIMTWSYFLNDVEDGKVCHVFEDEEYVLRLEDILQFATGCEVLPAGGFCGKPGIDFDHVSTDRKISVNTCAGVLHFPANESMRKLESMKEEFIFCILNGQGFGNV